jgi:hypothetical protein
MIEDRFADLIRQSYQLPAEEEQPQDTMLAAGSARDPVGSVTVSGFTEPQVVTDVMPEGAGPAPKPSGVRVGRGGLTVEQSAKAGGLDRPLIALLDTLAGALHGITAQTLGLPGDIRSILDMINKEGAAKYLGEPVLPTTERMQEILPAVVPQGVANQADREHTAKMFSNVGTFLPAPGFLEAPKLIKGAIQATKDMPVGMSIKPVGELGDALLMAVKVGDKELKIPGDKAAVLQKAIKNLTPEEQGKLRTDTAIKMVDILTTLPSTKEFAAAAVGGVAKKGWYEGSAKAIIEVFGQDAPRFAALLSATSPQTSVESNLYNALQVWKNWTAAGRPQDRESIISVMGQSVQGSKGEESVLDAWKNNSVRALTTEDPSTLTLSGPKVDSFMKNLQGNVEQVTNDAWMASFSLVDQTIFSGSLTKTDAGKGPGYLAMNARVRDTAKYLTKLTGETWTPAEVQETIWSWAKTVYEKSSDVNETRSALQLIKENAITDDLIASTPDFRTLFYDERYAPILEQAGYKDQLDKLRAATATDNARPGGKKPRSSSETGKALGNTQGKLLESNAKRLDKLRLSREQASAEKALNKQTFDGGE